MGTQLRSDVVAGPGGAMTDEVGVITGDLTVTTTDRGDGMADITVEYTGAEESYTLTGSPAPVPPGGPAALHEQTIALIRTGDATVAPQ